jgi:ankyrin repeat protein
MNAPAHSTEKLLEDTSKLSPSILANVLKCVLLGKMNTSNNEITNTNSTNTNEVFFHVSKLEDMSIMKCPSCHTPFYLENNRGCDAVWCSNETCRRAFCILCLQDCGNNIKTDETAKNNMLIGDAHEHVKNNDCGLTIPGLLFSSNETITQIHNKRVKYQWFMYLHRMESKLVTQIKKRLNITETQLEMTTFIQDYNKTKISNSDSDSTNGKIIANPKDLPWPWWMVKQQEYLCAAFNGDFKLVRQLVEVGGVPVDIEDVDGLGKNALMSAAARGHFMIVSYLLDRGLKCLQTDKSGQNSLHYVAKDGGTAGALQTARSLVIAAYRERTSEHFTTGKLWYPWTIEMNGGTTVSYFANSHKNIRDYFNGFQEKGHHLLVAAHSGNIQEVNNFLRPSQGNGISNEVAIAIAEDVVHFCDPGKDGQTALMFACIGRHTAVIDLLLKRGCKALRKDSSSGYNALHYLAYQIGNARGGIPAVRLLVRAAFEEVSKGKGDHTGLWYPWLIKTVHGTTVSDLAATNAELMAYFNGMQEKGHLLINACFSGNIREVETLMRPQMKSGVSEEICKAIAEDVIYFRDPGKDGQTCLMFAALQRHANVVELLLRSGLKVLGTDTGNGFNALHYLAFQIGTSTGGLETVRHLVRGALKEKEVNKYGEIVMWYPWLVKTNSGKTVKELASTNVELTNYFNGIEEVGQRFITACINGDMEEVNSLLTPSHRPGVSETITNAIAFDLVHLRDVYTNKTPIMIAATHKNATIAYNLTAAILEAGAHSNIDAGWVLGDGSDSTAYSYADSSGYDEILSLLILNSSSASQITGKSSKKK